MIQVTTAVQRLALSPGKHSKSLGKFTGVAVTQNANAKSSPFF
jgi:hypothetical protein